MRGYIDVEVTYYGFRVEPLLVAEVAHDCGWAAYHYWRQQLRLTWLDYL